MPHGLGNPVRSGRRAGPVRRGARGAGTRARVQRARRCHPRRSRARLGHDRGPEGARGRRVAVDPLDLVEPARFARNGYPHAAWARLRAEAPVAFFDPPGFESFWAITRHADITEISSQPTLFSSEHGLFVGPEGSTYPPSEMVVTIDPPRHGPMRRVAIRRFTPR